MMHSVAVPQEISEALALLKHVRAILLTGSRSVGMVTSNSDWDFVVLLADGKPPWRKTWKVADTWLEIFCQDEPQIRSYFQHDLKEGKGIVISMFATGQIVHDSADGVLQRLTRRAKQLWKKGPQPLAAADRDRIDYTLTTSIQDIEDCLQLGSRADLIINQALGELVQCYYLLQRAWLPRPKDRLTDLQWAAPEYWAIVDRIGRESDWRERAWLAIRFGRKLAEQYGLPLSGEYYYYNAKL
jgi:hypothetical protein